MSEQDLVIQIDNVSKDFILPHQKINSLKGAFTNVLRHKSGRSIEHQHALRGISFDVKSGEFLGIVGRNGSGKSTLLKIIAQIYQPTKGTVKVHGRLVPFIELGVGFNPELTGRENVYLSASLIGFARKEIDAMYGDIVEFAELEKFMDQKLKNYSSGMQVRLGFSIATRAHGDILLIDEVLAVGDADFQLKCFNYFHELKRQKRTVVFVSHDMEAIRKYCDRVVLIEKSEIQSVGKADDVAREYARLFLKRDDGINDDTPEEKNRWGSGAMKFTKCSSRAEGDHIFVKAVAKVNQNVENVLYGLHITSQEGQELLATNNRLINKKILKSAKKGQKVEFQWEILNVFVTGKYSLTLTMGDDIGVVYDWYVGIDSFIVDRAERSTTSIIPPIEVSYSIE